MAGGYKINGYDDNTHDGLPSPAMKKVAAWNARSRVKPLPYTPADRIKARKLPWKKGRITDFQQY